MMVSRDGKTVYAVDGADVRVFQRNKTSGALTQIPSPSFSNVSGPIGVTADQQGTPTSVYVAGSNNVVGVFGRNKSTGALTQLAGTNGCVSAGGGACTSAPRLASIGSLSRLFAYKTNRYVYVAGSSGVAAFGRTKSGANAGALTPLADPAGCVNETGTGHCLIGKGIGRPDGHLLHRRRQAHLRRRDDLRLGRHVPPGRLARSRFDPAYACSARAYAGFLFPDFQPSSSQLRSRSSA